MVIWNAVMAEEVLIRLMVAPLSQSMMYTDGIRCIFALSKPVFYLSLFISSNLSEKEKRYYNTLQAELLLSTTSETALSTEAKLRLLQLRVDNNISSNLHANFLKKLNWTLLEYEVSDYK